MILNSIEVINFLEVCFSHKGELHKFCGDLYAFGVPAYPLECGIVVVLPSHIIEIIIVEVHLHFQYGMLAKLCSLKWNYSMEAFRIKKEKQRRKDLFSIYLLYLDVHMVL